MDRGVADSGVADVIVIADDPSNASTTTEVADYTSVPPITEATIPVGKNVNNAAETKASDDGNYSRNGGPDYLLEAPILAEDVVRAGGLGARDELGHVLPSAMDATDFEASLRDAQQYEDTGPEKDIPRPGVGFVKDQQNRMDGVREI